MTMLYCIVLFLAISNALDTSDFPRNLLGVNPSDKELYSGDSFMCRDESEMLDISKVNDDFCDCADGSDEPGTSACLNGKFFCVNEGSTSKILPSSRVGDGICDCCDGSDEWVSGTTSSCENTCVAENAVRMSQHSAANEQRVKGSEVLKVWIEQSVSALMELQKKVEESKRKVDELNAQKKALNDKIDSFDGNYDAEPRGRKLEKLVSTPEMSALSHSLNIIQLSSNQLTYALTYLITKGGTSDQLLTHLQQITQKMNGGEEEKRGNVEVSAEQVEKAMRSVDLSSLDDLLDIPSMNAKLSQLETDIYTAETEVRANSQSMYYGPHNEFFMMKGMCVKTEIKGYSYSVCPFGEAKQDFNSLGSTFSILTADGKPLESAKWDNVIVDETLFPDHKYFFHWIAGTPCWSGSSRNLRLEVKCGSELGISEISEPSMCSYTGVFTTPSACPIEL